MGYGPGTDLFTVIVRDVQIAVEANTRREREGLQASKPSGLQASSCELKSRVYHPSEGVRMSDGKRKVGLESVGLEGVANVQWTLGVASLYEEAIRRHEGVISAEGPLVCSTGQHTGRSPNDKFLVKEPTSEKNVGWGKVNRPIDADKFESLHQ